MLIFSTIVAILSPVLYLLPFIVGLVKKEKMYAITWKHKKKVIDNKWILIAKVLLLILLTIAFIFTFPTKVMFYPVKVTIFTAILLVIMLLTGIVLLDERENLLDRAIPIWLILLVITLLIGGVGFSSYNDKIYQTPLTFTIESKIEEVNSGGIVFYYKDYGSANESDLRLDSFSINDDNVQIHIIEENQPSHLLIHATREQYSIRYDKDGKLYPDKDKYSESYDVYIPKTELMK